MSSTVQPSRRERIRAEALDEMRAHGYRQIEQGGAAALSLNGIARAMGMSGAAMYRYFPSRDALLTTLICESYEDLSRHLASALDRARRRSPDGRLRAVADAYRDWALAQPHRYRLIFQSDLSSATGEPERIIAAAQQAMDVILAALIDLGPAGPAVAPARLAPQLVHWGAGTAHPDHAAELYLRAQITWSRLHGVVSLEIEGVYDQMGIDAAAIYAGEIRNLIAVA